jgi:hypothetical protein
MRMGRATSSDALEELHAWARRLNDDEDGELQPWNIGRAELALRLLDRIDPSTTDQVRTAAVRAGLSGRPNSNWHNKVVGAMAVAFPNGPGKARVPFNQLRAPQRELVRRLAVRWSAFWPPVDGPRADVAEAPPPDDTVGTRLVRLARALAVTAQAVA